MNCLNKKLTEPVTEIWDALVNQNLLALTVYTLILVILESLLSFNLLLVLLIYLPAVVLSIILRKRSRDLLMLIFLLSLIFLLEIINVLIVATALLATLITYSFLRLFCREDLTLVVLANLAHLGDAITTYLGLSRGFSEQNPFVLLVLDSLGYKYIFVIKFLVLPVTLYIYFKMPSKKANLTLKAIFLIGLYLTIGNLFVIL